MDSGLVRDLRMPLGHGILSEELIKRRQRMTPSPPLSTFSSLKMLNNLPLRN
jgi:hypothetical protein